MKENVGPAPINATQQYTPRQPLASITNQSLRDTPVWKIPNTVKSNDLIQGYSEKVGYPITYCWSCGITGNLLHHSKRCKSKKDGHKEKATLTNQMGGNPNKVVSAFKKCQVEKGKTAVKELGGQKTIVVPIHNIIKVLNYPLTITLLALYTQ